MANNDDAKYFSFHYIFRIEKENIFNKRVIFLPRDPRVKMPSVPDYFDCFWHVAPHRENSHGPGESFILTRAINLKLANSVQVRENLENRQNLGIHGISKFLSQPSSFMGSED